MPTNNCRNVYYNNTNSCNMDKFFHFKIIHYFFFYYRKKYSFQPSIIEYRKYKVILIQQCNVIFIDIKKEKLITLILKKPNTNSYIFVNDKENWLAGHIISFISENTPEVK